DPGVVPAAQDRAHGSASGTVGSWRGNRGSRGKQIGIPERDEARKDINMAAIQERQATTVWTGTLMEGEGRVSAGTGAFTDQMISLPTRTGEASGNPSPEEYLAASHSGCLAMNISGVMTNN